MANILRRPEPQNLFSRDLRKAIAKCRRSGQTLALLVVQINQLEKVEGTLGYSASQELAGHLLERITSVLHDHDNIVKVGDRKFWVTLVNPKNEGHAILAANKISRLASKAHHIQGHAIKLDVSTGIALYPEHATEPEELVRRADLALASVAESDASYTVYSFDSTSKMASLWQIESELERALEQSEFELHYQPKINLHTFEPCGVEALLRWDSPASGRVSPEVFLPIAEKAGKMDAITNFVINTALRQQSEWPAHSRDMPVSVNIPASFLAIDHLAAMVKDSLKIWGSKPGNLVLEVTESSVIMNKEQTFSVLNSLRSQGLRVSIDDFGTGYSSMALFKELPADELKIDKSFIFQLIENEGDEHIVRTIIDLAHTFGFSVVAEGVENEATLDALIKLKCDIAQGFWFSMPLPQHELIEWLNERKCLKERAD